jgi:hypothetical protein
MTRKSWTFEDHCEAGRRIKEARALLISLHLPTKAHNAKLNRALRVIGEIRSQLDGQLFRENPGREHKELCEVYYGGNSDAN